MKLPKPMSPKPSSNKFMGSEKELLMIAWLLVIEAVALTQNSRTAAKPTVDRIYRDLIFIHILLALLTTIKMKPGIAIAIEMPGKI
jgi:hypothetical protein